MVSGLLACAAPADAAIRYKRSGEATLGGADALAGVRDACEIGSGRIWVAVDGRGECIAFYPTRGLAGAATAVIFFEGDIPRTYSRDREKLAAHLRAVQRSLEMHAIAFKVPYVLMARPGTFGSTGDHADRRKDREYLVMREAVDALRERFELGQVVLAGQSGGATIAAALLTLGITQVRCVVPASGAFDLAAMLDWHTGRQGAVSSHHENPATLHGSFNVMERIAGIRSEKARRVVVIADREDKVTPFSQQRRFAEALGRAGHHAILVEAFGTGAERHGLTSDALKLAGLCATGASDADIRRGASR